MVHEWFAGCERHSHLSYLHNTSLTQPSLTIDRTEEVRRLGMGPLLSDLAQKMQTKAEKGDADAAKILIHSTHDTCLAGLSNTLDIFDERYVTFTMHMLNVPTNRSCRVDGLLSQLPLRLSCSRSIRQPPSPLLRGKACCRCLAAIGNRQSTVRSSDASTIHTPDSDVYRPPCRCPRPLSEPGQGSAVLCGRGQASPGLAPVLYACSLP